MWIIIGVGFVLVLLVCVISSCMLSSDISQDEEKLNGDITE